MTQKNRWRQTILWLHRNFKPVVPVHVRCRKLITVQGVTWKYDGIGCITIVINDGPCWCCKIDSLIHEWAHAITWFGSERDQEHPAEWGIAYAKIYSLFLEWNYGNG